jgi:ubiquinone/menaquinone biosynthesis C-methylase UbiE
VTERLNINPWKSGFAKNKDLYKKRSYFSGGKHKDGVQFPKDGSFLDPNSEYRHKALDLLNMLNISEPGLVADIGSGPGHLAYWAKKMGKPFSVISCDISFYILNEHAKEHGLAIQAEVERLPFAQESLIGIVFSDILEHVEPQDALQALCQAHFMLKENACLLINIPNMKTWSDAAQKDPGHVWLPTITELQQLLRDSGFNKKAHIHTRGFPFSDIYRKVAGKDLRLPVMGRSIQLVVKK